jgi:hypothetical protein
MSANDESVLTIVKRGKKKGETKTKMMPARQLYRRSTAARVLDCDISLLKAIEKDGTGRLTPIRLHGTHVHYEVGQVHALARGGKRGVRPR